MASFKVLKEHNANSKFYTHKIASRRECEINIFSDKQKKGEFVATRSIVEESSKKFFQVYA